MFYKITTSINPEFQYFTKNRDTIFFLGAGFSADLGLPIMKDFRSASELEFNKKSQEDSLYRVQFSGLRWIYEIDVSSGVLIKARG
ncbi:MAG: hypothetical protein WCI27_03260 [Candidatus Omnitrophota bacterium]